MTGMFTSHNIQSKPVTLRPKTIRIVVEDTNKSIYNDPNFSFSVKFRFFYDKYKKLFILLLLLIIVAIIAIISLVSSKQSNDNPCNRYIQDDTSSSVSMECFRHLWKNSCNADVPNGFDGGWWLKSPQCVPPKVIENCGSGTYGNMVSQIFICNLYYKGHY